MFVITTSTRKEAVNLQQVDRLYVYGSSLRVDTSAGDLSLYKGDDSDERFSDVLEKFIAGVDIYDCNDPIQKKKSPGRPPKKEE